MFGVVLWSDQIRNRAVIWCEDHGDLAFFSGDDENVMDGAAMEPGDLVQFDVRSERHMRLASNPKLVATDEYPTLANDLMKAGSDLDIQVKTHNRQSSGKIVVSIRNPRVNSRNFGPDDGSADPVNSLQTRNRNHVTRISAPLAAQQHLCGQSR